MTVGPVFAVTFVVTGLSSLAAGNLSARVGVVRSVVWARLAGLVLLVLLYRRVFRSYDTPPRPVLTPADGNAPGANTAAAGDRPGDDAPGPADHR